MRTASDTQGVLGVSSAPPSPSGHEPPEELGSWPRAGVRVCTGGARVSAEEVGRAARAAGAWRHRVLSLRLP